MFQRNSKRSIRAILNKIDGEMDRSTGRVGEVDLSGRPELYDGAVELLQRARAASARGFTSYRIARATAWGAIPGLAVLGLLVGGVAVYRDRADKQELARRVESVEVRKILDSAMKSSHQDQVALRINDLAMAPALMSDAVATGSWEFSNSFLAPASQASASSPATRERVKADSDVVRQRAALAICLLGQLGPPVLGESGESFSSVPGTRAPEDNLNISDMLSAMNSIHAVPEPGAFSLMGVALVTLAGAGLVRRKR